MFSFAHSRRRINRTQEIYFISPVYNFRFTFYILLFSLQHAKKKEEVGFILSKVVQGLLSEPEPNLRALHGDV